MNGNYAVMPMSDYISTCDTIKEKTGADDNHFLSGELPDKIDEVFKAGIQEHMNRLQNYGNKTQYNGAFQATMWNDNTYNPQYPIVASMANNMYAYNTAITDTKVPIDISGASSAVYLFQGATAMVTIVLLKVKSSQTYTNFFQDNSKLKNITFAEGSEIGRSISFADSPLLTAVSAISVINHLVYYKGTINEGKYTVTFHANAWTRLQTWWASEHDGQDVKEYIASLGWATA